jgi:hypothetical protein
MMPRTMVADVCLCEFLGLPCECERSGPGRPLSRPHGTPAAARRHYRRGERLCAPCKQAERARWREAGDRDCECGCGGRPTRGHRYVHGHNRRRPGGQWAQPGERSRAA